MDFLRRAPLQMNKQAETGGEKLRGRVLPSVISTDAAEELFPNETVFQTETNYHMSVCWEVQGIQKQVELVGKRRKVRKSKLLSVEEWFAWVSQPVRYVLHVPQRPKKCSQERNKTTQWDLLLATQLCSENLELPKGMM